MYEYYEGGRFMSKCPFWSNKRESVSCYKECPMYPKTNKYEECPFNEYLSTAINIKEEVKEDYEYSENNLYDLVGSFGKY